MVRLVVSDIDGTLIPYGEAGLSPELFPLIRRLHGRGMLFCTASGRQYHSLRGLFAPVAEEIYCLCENGAAVFGPGAEEDAPLLVKAPMPLPEALALADGILAVAGWEVLISGQNTSYVSARNPAFAERMRLFTGNRVRTVAGPREVPEEILKVSAFCPEDMDRAKDLLGPRWGARFRMAVAGPEWLDFTATDKGEGLARLLAALGLSPAEVMAFGDNWNDLPMLRLAGRPYLMEGAAAELRALGLPACGRVEDVLTQLLEGMEC